MMKSYDMKDYFSALFWSIAAGVALVVMIEIIVILTMIIVQLLQN